MENKNDLIRKLLEQKARYRALTILARDALETCGRPGIVALIDQELAKLSDETEQIWGDNKVA